jgi:hypothetical protein
MQSVGTWIIVSYTVAISQDGAVPDSELRNFRVPPGEKWVTGNPYVVGFFVESNNTRAVAEYKIGVLYHLTDPTDEATYCSGEMIADQTALMDTDTYQFARTFGGAIEILEPRLSSPVTRVGNVIEYCITVPVVLDSVT